MTARVMLFAALVSTPAAAFLAPFPMLLFFILFPAGAIISLDWKYFRNALLLVTAPSAALCWAWFTGNEAALHGSVRWICALAAGSYFARSLTPMGIAAVLRSFPRCGFCSTLAESMETAGRAAGHARSAWRSSGALPFRDRVTHTLRCSLKNSEPGPGVPETHGNVPVTLSVVSWLFFIAALSGRL